MQFLLYLYHNHSADFVPLCMSNEFLSALAATLFPYKPMSETNSEIMSPVDDFRVRTINSYRYLAAIGWIDTDIITPVSYTHLTLPTNREV